MGSHAVGPNREADIWARLLRSRTDALPVDAARFLLTIDFGEEDKRRMIELAERSSAGTLTDTEQTELDSYLNIGNFLAIMQSRARQALSTPIHPQ